MLLYAAAFGVFGHLWFWGAGGAWLLLPQRYRRFWPVFAFPAGAALQSVVVWMGAYTGLRGTDRYAWPAELIPLVLLAFAWRRGLLLRQPLARLGGVAASAFASLAALAWPLAHAAKGLTTASLGSCDAADYAAGARVLQEFAHGDRSGFIGLTEVVHIASVDNFFDFWLRLNHFTPSALLAFNGTIFHCRPHELCGILPFAIIAGTVPIVFWIARALFNLRSGPSVFLAVLYGFSPLVWYAADQVAIGQLLAAPAIGLLTWAAIALWRGRLSAPAGRSWFGVLAVAFVLIWGAYNFMVIVCLVPAIAYVGVRAVWENRLPRALPWFGWVLAPLAATGLLLWARVAGLAERFALFQTYDFGWHIPVFTPEGWLGLVHGPDLSPWSSGPRVVAAIVALALLLAALARAARRGWSAALLPPAVAIPVLLGYSYLIARGHLLGTNASYDAYKLFSVFYPLLLPAAAYWLTLFTAPGLPRFAAFALSAVVAIGTLAADRGFIVAMSAPPLIVDRDLIGIQNAERTPQIASLNMRLPQMWERLWANAFLLRRPQYFETHTYEGRLDTALHGDWDLTGDLVAIGLPKGDSVQLDAHYAAVRTASPYYLRAKLGAEAGEAGAAVAAAGWYLPERIPRTSIVWRWTGDAAAIEIDNPQAWGLQVVPRFEVASLDARPLQLWSGEKELGSAPTARDRAVVSLPPVEVPPGHSEWSLRSDRPAVQPSPGDARRLSFSIYGVRLDVQPQKP